MELNINTFFFLSLKELQEMPKFEFVVLTIVVTNEMIRYQGSKERIETVSKNNSCTQADDTRTL